MMTGFVCRKHYTLARDSRELQPQADVNDTVIKLYLSER